MAQLTLGLKAGAPMSEQCKPGECIPELPAGYYVETGEDGIERAWWVISCKLCWRVVKKIRAPEGAAR